jgi:hypothetical protein
MEHPVITISWQSPTRQVMVIEACIFSPHYGRMMSVECDLDAVDGPSQRCHGRLHMHCIKLVPCVILLGSDTLKLLLAITFQRHQLPNVLPISPPKFLRSFVTPALICWLAWANGRWAILSSIEHSL